MPKRILVVCQHFYPEVFRINDICRSLAEKNIQVDVLCGIPNYPEGRFFKGYNYFKPRREQWHGINILRTGEIPQWKKGGKLFVALNYLFFPFVSFFHIPGLLLRKKHDCVFLYTPSPVFMGFTGIIYAKLRRIKSVHYILDYWPDSLYSVIPLKNKFLRFVLKKTSLWHYKKSDIVLTPSRGILGKLRAETGIPMQRSFFLPQSCPEAYETPVYSKLLHEEYSNKFNIVFAGNVGPAQSLETLLEAVSVLKKENYAAIETLQVIILGDGMSMKEIKQKAEKLGVAGYFAFKGFVCQEKVLEYQELADALYVSLSDDPLFSLMLPAKVQSYMAAGKPILASLNGEGADAIMQAGCGLVCNSGDRIGLSNAITKLITSSDEKRKELGRNARRYYNDNYRHDVFMKSLIEYMNM